MIDCSMARSVAAVLFDTVFCVTFNQVLNAAFESAIFVINVFACLKL